MSQADAARERTKEASKASTIRPELSMRLVVLGTMFVAAFCLRLYRINEPLFDFVPVRQYHSALLARGFYEWLLSGNLKTLPPDGIIEPPILEALASLSYLITGAEHLWIPRVLSAIFWMVGAIFLYLIARKIISSNAAIFSVGFYLLDPAVVLPSRAFMPDPLMIMMLVISVYAILRYHEQPTAGRLMVAAIASSWALFVKPGICLFQIFGALIVPMVSRRGLLRSLTSAHLFLFALLSLLPVGLYYVWFLQGEAAARISPESLLSPSFWRGWLWQIEYMVGYVAFAAAVLGVLLLRPGLPRALMVGLWGGYFLFGLVFARHVHTHDYYSLQLIPVVALSLGSAWDSLTRYLWRAGSGRFLRVTIVGVILLALTLGVFEHRGTIELVARQGQGAAFPGRYVSHGTTADYERRAEIYREIGEIVDHSPNTILFAPDYGYSLIYHGRLDGHFLYPESRTVRKDFAAIYAESAPRYAIVIKRFAYYPRQVNWGGRGKKHRSLSASLTRKFGVIVNDHAYVVFDLSESGVGRAKRTG